ncbi:MAG: heat-inducible transcriptional repressor HrcA [Christensenellales bacterium]
MGLDGRKLKILQAIIDDYIATAVPIGSRTISKKYDIGYSSATIRNEMSDLEEMGFLDQPHTSAGRVPSQKAYRLYVDHMIKGLPLSPAEDAAVKAYFNIRMGELENVLKCATKALADLTSYTSVALVPERETVNIQHIQLVPVSIGRVLVVVVTDAGVVKDLIIRVPEEVSVSLLDHISRLLTAELKGKTPEDIPAVAADVQSRKMAEYHLFLEDILECLNQDMIERRNEGPDMVLEGVRNILNFPEYSDVEKAKHFLELFDSKDPLASMLAQMSDMEFSVKIGDENEMEELKSCSVITAMYRIGSKGIGTLGVIGPVRMDYQRVISVLNYIGNNLSRVLKDL